jgi:hypothetical protein
MRIFEHAENKSIGLLKTVSKEKAQQSKSIGANNWSTCAIQKSLKILVASIEEPMHQRVQIIAPRYADGPEAHDQSVQ